MVAVPLVLLAVAYVLLPWLNPYGMRSPAHTGTTSPALGDATALLREDLVVAQVREQFKIATASPAAAQASRPVNHIPIVSPESAGPEDSEWLKLPRLNWSVPLRFANDGIKDVRGKELYRHKTLNPRERYLSPSSRDTIGSAVRQLAGEMERLLAVAALAAREEMNVLISHRLLQPLRVLDNEHARSQRQWLRKQLPDMSEEAIDAKALVLDPRMYGVDHPLDVWEKRDGAVYAVQYGQLLLTKEIRDYCDYKSEEFLNIVLSMFCSANCISDKECEKIFQGFERVRTRSADVPASRKRGAK